ncbi:MAG: hypothetical protein ACRD50_16235 [Candidatus Acidiferrales bacterium]
MALRRKFYYRTAIFLSGSIAFVAASGRYPPLDLDGILIFGGVFFFVTLALAILFERRAVRHLEVEALKRVYYGLVPVPWLLGLLLLLNGALDHAAPIAYNETVVGKFSMSGFLPTNRLVVTSWRSGKQVERVPVSRLDADRFHAGDSITVQVKGGLAGIPWVESVSSR